MTKGGFAKKHRSIWCQSVAYHRKELPAMFCYHDNSLYDEIHFLFSHEVCETQSSHPRSVQMG